MKTRVDVLAVAAALMGALYPLEGNARGSKVCGAQPSSITANGFNNGGPGLDGDHTCAIVNGAAHCWGNNFTGQLGNNSTTNSSVPVPVSGLTRGVTAIAAGDVHTCAIVNGGVLCWGFNPFGQLGPPGGGESDVPVPVSGLTSGVTAIAGGGDYNCAIVNGGAQCWGINQHGELGGDLASNVDSEPTTVAGLASGVQAIATGSEHACAIVNGGARCWGDNTFGELGSSTSQVCPFGDPCSTRPVQVSGLTSGVTAIGAGFGFTCAIVNGGVQCWGLNDKGQLGNNSTASSAVPVPVSGLSIDASAVAVGGDFACAIANGGVQCWGDNAFGQLGNNSTTSSAVPVPVSGLTSGVTAIAAGADHNCAIVSGGVECWGLNSDGELGDNSTANSSVPVSVSGL
ncbi:MAG TPA: hypothetical protein VMK12_15240 [Anaeromyxobacteraceae bacterium]|nr:hypothetical protein [Anaeromyxobacteraceae bacterium]